jgi:hypothetical protein
MQKIDDAPLPCNRHASKLPNRRSAVAKSPPRIHRSARKVLEGMRCNPAFFELDFFLVRLLNLLRFIDR